MNPFKYDKAYQEALGVFEGFRKLGFVSDDLYITVNGPLRDVPFDFMVGKLQLLLTLRTQGKFFHVDCGLVNDTPENAAWKWEKLGRAVNEGRVSQEHLDKIWQASQAHQDPEGFVMSLKAKGFLLPSEMSFARS